MSGLFDLDNVDDLPDDIKKEIKATKSQPENYYKILELFEQAGQGATLTIDQVTVALYRAYNIKLERARVGRQLYYLVRKGFLLNHERRGAYVLKPKPEQEQGENDESAGEPK